MALLPILHYPDPRLHTKAMPVPAVDARVQKLVRDMLETMYQANGIGLAATQVDVHERILVIDVSEARNEPRAFINPVLLMQEGACESEEGCLSVPGIYDKVTRSEKVTVQALNEQGELFKIHAQGLLGVCLQHEIDHLDGKVFVERLSRLKQERIQKKLLKQQRQSM